MAAPFALDNAAGALKNSGSQKGPQPRNPQVTKAKHLCMNFANAFDVFILHGRVLS